MAELSENSNFSSLLLSDFLFLFSILSDPLYFFYLLFFSPYLLKLISFLSPIFFTTSLLITAVVQDAFSAEFLARMGWAPLVFEVEFLQGIHIPEYYEAVFGIGIESKETTNTRLIEEMREIPVGSSEEKSQENEISWHETAIEEGEIATNSVSHQDSVSGVKMETVKTCEDEQPEKEEERKVNFLKILNDFEKMTSGTACSPSPAMKPTGIGRNNSRTPSLSLFPATTAEKITNNRRASSSSALMKTQSDSTLTMMKTHSDSFNRISYRGIAKTEDEQSFGRASDKEWKTTLGGRLFEERENEEGMDSLWEETYEAERKTPTSAKKGHKKNKTEVYVSEEEEEEIGVPGGELCCLLALKLSTGKMHRGVGRRSLARISKVMKGFRWLNHVSKKIHSDGDKMMNEYQ